MCNSPIFASGLCCLEQRLEDFVLADNELRNVDVSVLKFVWSGENAAHDSSQGSHVYRVEFAGAVVVQCGSALFGVKAEGIPFRSLEWPLENVVNCVVVKEWFRVPYPVEERAVNNSCPAGSRVLRNNTLKVLYRVHFSLENGDCFQYLGICGVLRL